MLFLLGINFGNGCVVCMFWFVVVVVVVGGFRIS